MTQTVTKAQAHYEIARTLLMGLLVVVVLGSLALIVVGVLDVRQQGRVAVEQREQLRELLLRQDRADSTRQQIVDDAIGRIAQSQREALTAHDARTAEMLRAAKLLLDQEVNAPRSQERMP